MSPFGPHHNPLKANITEQAEQYRWSIYNDYLNGDSDFVDIDFMLSMLCADKNVATRLFVEFHDDSTYTDFTISDGKKPTDEQLKRKASALLGETALNKLYLLPKPERDSLISLLRQNGFTIGQLERLTGISRGIITRAK